VAGEETGMAAGSSTVADRPTRRRPGASVCSRDSAQHQLVAALAFGQRVDLVDDHALQPREDARRVLVGQEQRQAFGRGQQDVRRVGALAALLGRLVSPVRSSTRIGRPISVDGRVRLRRMSAASAFSGET
jgi:hypothetical protein